MKRISMITAFLLGVSIAASAESKIWTLQECIDYAVENNISLRQSRNTYASGLEDTYQAKAAMFPTLSASTSQGFTNRPFSDTGSNTVIGSEVYSTSKSTSYSGNYGLNAGMTLYNGGYLRNSLAQSKVQNSIDSLSVEESTNDVIISIVQAYMQCLYAKEAVNLAISTSEASKAQRDRAVELKNAGELSKVDVAQLESQYASDLYQVTSSKVNLDNCKLTLKQLLELGVTDDIEVSMPENEEDEVLKILPTKEIVCDNAVEAMPEIRRAKLNIDAAKLSLKQAKTGYLPTLSASAGLGTSNVTGMENSFASQIEKNFNESLGLSLSIPIAQGRRTKTAVNKAKIAADNSLLEQMSIEKNLMKEVENTYLSAVSAQSQYVSAKEQEKYASQSYELTSEQFKIGMKNTVELITAQNNLLSARVSLLQAKYTALLNNTLLDIYQGNYKTK